MLPLESISSPNKGKQFLYVPMKFTLIFSFLLFSSKSLLGSTMRQKDLRLLPNLTTEKNTDFYLNLSIVRR